jgi:hypothetical protein
MSRRERTVPAPYTMVIFRRSLPWFVGNGYLAVPIVLGDIDLLAIGDVRSDDAFQGSQYQFRQTYD